MNLIFGIWRSIWYLKTWFKSFEFVRPFGICQFENLELRLSGFWSWLSEFDCFFWRSFEPICLFSWPSLNLSVNIWLFVLKIIGVCICSVCFGSCLGINRLLWIRLVSLAFGIWNSGFGTLNLIWSSWRSLSYGEDC